MGRLVIAAGRDVRRGQQPRRLVIAHDDVGLPPRRQAEVTRLRRRDADLGVQAAVLAKHRQVAAVITGHAHTAAVSTFAGRPLIVGPAITWTLRLPWEGDQAADLEQPPGLAFHILDDDGRLTTHYRVVL